MIGIAEVLARIDTSPIDGAFSLTFIKRDGSVRKIERAQKGIQSDHTSTSAKSNFRYNIKQKGVVLVADLDAINKRDKFKTIKISRIIKFNNIPVHH